MPGRAAVESPRGPACPLRIRGRCRVFSKTRSVHDCSLGHHRLWRAINRLWDLGDSIRDVGGCRQPADAGDRGRDRGRRAGLSQAPVHDHRYGWCCRVQRHPLPAREMGRDRLPDRRPAIRRRRLHRHERICARERAYRAGRDQVARRGARHLVQGRRRDGHARCRPRAARRCDLLRVPDRPARLQDRRPHRDRRARRALVRRLADLDLCPSRWRHLHQRR